MADDGNCQFRALAMECFGDQSWHGQLRAKVVAYIEVNRCGGGGLVQLLL